MLLRALRVAWQNAAQGKSGAAHCWQGLRWAVSKTAKEHHAKCSSIAGAFVSVPVWHTQNIESIIITVPNRTNSP